MSVTDPVIVKFSAEQLRVAADSLETAALVLETLVGRYEDWQVEANVMALLQENPENANQVIEDGAVAEGRPIYTIGYLANYIANARKMLADFNADLGNGYTLRRQLRYMATNPRNPLLK